MNNSLNTTEGRTKPMGTLYDFVPEPFAMMVVRYTLFAVLFSVALIGNVLVFAASRKNRHLRSFSYRLITNLAVSDFLSVLAIPFYLITKELGNRWVFGEAFCHLLNPSHVLCGMVTTNVHTAIAFERFCSIVHPFRSKVSGSQGTLVVSLIWLLALLCALPAYAARTLITVGGKQYCMELFPRPYRRVYTSFLFFINYCIPIIIMMFLYSRVMFTLKMTKQRRRESSDAHYTILEKRFIKLACLIMMIFIFCYLPFQVFYVLLEFNLITQWPYAVILGEVVFLITWFPNALNPICYGAIDKHYGKAFSKIFSSLRRICNRKYEPDESSATSETAV